MTRSTVSFVRFNTLPSNGAEFGGPFGLERTHTTQRDRAHTRKATRKIMHMRVGLMAVKSGVGDEAADEAKRGSTPR